MFSLKSRWVKVLCICAIQVGYVTQCSFLYQEYRQFCKDLKILHCSYKDFRAYLVQTDSKIEEFQMKKTYFVRNLRFNVIQNSFFLDFSLGQFPLIPL